MLTIMLSAAFACGQQAGPESKPYDKHIPKLGWKAPLPRLRKLPEWAAAPNVALPAKVTNSINAPPCLDQQQVGSCGLNMWDTIHWDALRRAGLQPYRSSRLYTYYRVRQAEGGNRALIRDTGVSIADIADMATRWGSPPESVWPYDGRPADPNTDIFPSSHRARLKPTADVDKLAKLHNAVCAHVRGDVASVRAALATGRPVGIGFTVYSNYFDQRTGDPVKVVQMPGPSDTIVGGHAVAVWDYDDAAAMFKIQNSWGTSLQDRGWFYMPYRFAELYSADYLVIDSVEPYKGNVQAHHVPAGRFEVVNPAVADIFGARDWQGPYPRVRFVLDK